MHNLFKRCFSGLILIGAMVSVPSHAAGLNGIAKIEAGTAHTCALTTAGGVQCWGSNSNGQLGDSTTTLRSKPVAVAGLVGGAADIAAGDFHSCALNGAGGVQCWGWNNFGQLGDNSATSRSQPVPVARLTSGVVAIAAGAFHTCALTAAGGVQCWGGNGQGQLGDNSTTTRLAPVAVIGLSGVVAIAAGEAHTCALTAAGAVQCWGFNGQGQLGDNTTTTRLMPVSVAGLTSGSTAIAAGNLHTCAIAGGGMQCWGNNNQGQLGDTTTVNRSAPAVVVSLASGVSAMAAGQSHTCAMAGGMKCWGNNTFGQLGDNTTTTRLAPTAVTGLASSVMSIAAGSAHTCAFATADGVKCWGNNVFGQLGDSSTTQRLTPSKVSVNALPEAPLSVVALPGNGQARVSFTAPDNGGLPITGYTVVASPAAGLDLNSATTALTHVVFGLTNGVTYTFTVTATNGAGVSAVSTASNPVTPSVFTQLPVNIAGVSLPSVFNMSVGKGPAVIADTVAFLSGFLGLELSYIRQNANGSIELSSKDGSRRTFLPLAFQSGDTRPDGLYVVGNGQLFSVVSQGLSFTMAPTLVNLDQLVALLPGISIKVNDNGSVKALFNGVTYVVQPDFAVTLDGATGTQQLFFNSDGTLGFTDMQGNTQVLAPALLEPITVRSIMESLDPTATLLVQTNGAVEITFNKQSYVMVPDLTLGGIPADRTGQPWWQESDSRFRLVNLSLAGTTQGLTVVPATVPGAPLIGTATAGNAQATVTFTTPRSNGGSAITGYTVVSNPEGGVDENAGSTGRTHLISGLANGKTYTFTVTATNAVGTGAASGASNSVKPVAPQVPAVP